VRSCALQGDDAVHDAVRIRQLEAGVPRRVTAALRQHGTVNDDVLWAALFTLAVLVRDDSAVFNRAASALVAAGVFRVSVVALFVFAAGCSRCTTCNTMCSPKNSVHPALKAHWAMLSWVLKCAGYGVASSL